MLNPQDKSKASIEKEIPHLSPTNLSIIYLCIYVSVYLSVYLIDQWKMNIFA